MEKNLYQTNITKQKPAPKVVQANLHTGIGKIKKIKYIGKLDVYNMEVKDHHNYSVEGGFIIHNCMDAMRYAIEPYTRNRGLRTISKRKLRI